MKTNITLFRQNSKRVSVLLALFIASFNSTAKEECSINKSEAKEPMHGSVPPVGGMVPLPSTALFSATDGTNLDFWGYNAATGVLGRVFRIRNTSTSAGIDGSGPLYETTVFNNKIYGFFNTLSGISFCSLDKNGLVVIDSTTTWNPSNSGRFTEWNGKLYFVGSNSFTSGEGFHIYEFNPTGSVLTKVSSSLYDAKNSASLEIYDDGGGEKLYFAGRTSASAVTTLYRYNGSSVSAAPGFSFSSPTVMKAFNGYLYIAACPNGQDKDNRLVRYNGSSTTQVLETNTNTGSFGRDDFPYYFTVFNSKLFFQSTQKSGTSTSAPINQVLYSINTSGSITQEYDPPNTGSNGPSQLFVTGGNLYFVADDQSNSDSELFRYNSTNNVTKITNTTSKRFIQKVSPYNGGAIFFQENDATIDDEPYYTDLSSSSLTLLGDINANGASYNSGASGFISVFDGEMAPYVDAGVSSLVVGASSATVIGGGVEVYDVDNDAIALAEVRIASGFQVGDILSATGQHGITTSYNSSTGVLTLNISGSATPTHVGDVLSSVSFSTSSGGVREVQFKVQDTDGNYNITSGTDVHKVELNVVSGAISSLSFDTKPAGLNTSSGNFVGSFSINDADLGNVEFKVTNDALTTAFGSLSLAFSAADYGMQYDANNELFIGMSASPFTYPKYLAIKAVNSFNFVSFDAIDRSWDSFDEYIVTGFLNGVQQFQETLSTDAKSKTTLSLNTSNSSVLVDEVRIDGNYTGYGTTGFSASLDNFLMQIPSSNTAPVASSVSVSGTLQVGETLTGSYTYSDADSDSESGSTFKWYRSDDAIGTNKIAISGATSTTYALAAADSGKYISFEVIPNDGTTAGSAAESSLQGDVKKLTVSIAGSSMISCYGGANGEIDLTVINGTAPYTVNWGSGSGNSTTISGLSSGSYTISVTDSNGVSTTTSITITQPDSLDPGKIQ